jgi:hypothetical protein
MQSRASDCERFRVANFSSFSFVRASLIRTSLMVLVAGGATLLLAGCGPKRVRADFTHYENSYAVTSNQEMLLNLARLEQHDPTYFFKLGQINSSYRMEAALTGTGQVSTLANPPASVIPTGGGSPTLLYENDPSFSFIPVNDQTNAQLLISPVPENVFYSLFQQGWRIDQLFRLMVDRIEVTLPPDPSSPIDKGCRIEVIRNVPPPAFEDPNSPEGARSLSRYVTFLRVSAVVYELQQHGLLLLRGTNTFSPIDKDSFIPNTADTGGATGDGKKPATSTTTTPPPENPATDVKSQSGGDAAGKNAQLPAAKDFNDAAGKSQEWVLQGADANHMGGVWVLGQKTLAPKFQLNTMVPDASAQNDQVYGQSVKTVEDLLRNDLLPYDPSVASLAQAPELTDTLEVLYSGFAIGGSATDQDTGIGPCTSEGNKQQEGGKKQEGNKPHYVVTSHLVLRSLIGLMAAAAQEQSFYDALAKSGKDPVITIGQDDIVKRIHIGLLVAQGLDPTKQDDPDYLKLAGAVAGKQAPFSLLVPPIERLPVLRLTWPAEVKPGVDPSASDARGYGLAVTYRRKDYVVADVDPAAVTSADYAVQNETWNRDMFRLINELSSQVTVDISKFPLPDILQLRTE